MTLPLFFLREFQSFISFLQCFDAGLVAFDSRGAPDNSRAPRRSPSCYSSILVPTLNPTVLKILDLLKGSGPKARPRHKQDNIIYQCEPKSGELTTASIYLNTFFWVMGAEADNFCLGSF